MEIDGRRMMVGLPVALLRGLQGAAGGSAAAAPIDAAPEKDPRTVYAPAAGNLHAWKVAEGDTVAEGDLVAVMEAMKMEMQVLAHRSGRIALTAATGSYQAAGAALATIG
jgi:acetyl-CoA/propionyl-CoA carboxylase biotin carboxyl carrier protein